MVFSQLDACLKVAELIRESCTECSGFTTHRALARALLETADGKSFVQAAALGSKMTEKRLASNMVAWFSKTITTATNPYRHLVLRRRVGGRWAYRWCN